MTGGVKGLFRTRSIAVVGASTSPGELGRATLADGINGGFEGAIYRVNPEAGEILGLPVFQPGRAAEGYSTDTPTLSLGLNQRLAHEGENGVALWLGGGPLASAEGYIAYLTLAPMQRYGQAPTKT